MMLSFPKKKNNNKIFKKGLVRSFGFHIKYEHYAIYIKINLYKLQKNKCI